MATKHGGQVVVEALKSEGVELLFGLAGSHILHIYDALYDDGIRCVTVKHEENASRMAEVYGRLVKKPGVCLVTAGPGATHSVTGVAQAFQAASPMIHISGNVPKNSPPWAFHGVADPDFLSKMFSSITKWSVRVEAIRELPTVIARAFRVAMSGEKGPVHLDIPMDVLQSSEEVDPYRREEVKSNLVDKGRIREVCKVLSKAENPVLYIGVHTLMSNVSQEIRELVNTLGAPFIVGDRVTIDMVSQDHLLFAGCAGDPVATETLREADVVLLLGTRLEMGQIELLKKTATGELISINPIPNPAHQKYGIEMVVGDLQPALRMLIENIGRMDKGTRIKDRLRGRWEELDKKLKDMIGDVKAKPINEALVVSELKRFINKETILAGDVGGNTVWLRRYLVPRTPHVYLDPGNYGSMGFALPAAIAASIIFPDRRAVAVTGDGGFLMACMELPTAMENKTNPVTVIFNDSMYGMIWQLQMRRYGGRSRERDVRMHTTNFAKLAESFGAKGIRVEEPSDLSWAYEEAFNSKIPAVVDIVVDYKKPYPFQS